MRRPYYLLYFIFAVLYCSMSTVVDPFIISICPRGQWRALELAKSLRQFTIVDNGRQLKLPERIKIGHRSIAVESHDTKKDGVFCAKWVYICPNLSDNASLTSIKKTDFIKLCQHLSDKKNWQQDCPKMTELFETYTGLEMTADSIRAAFDAGVLVSEATLEATAKQNEEEAKAAREKICYKGVFARKTQRQRLDNVENTTARDEFLERDVDGTWRSRDCTRNNATAGQCSVCKNLNVNFGRKWKILDSCAGVNATDADACKPAADVPDFEVEIVEQLLDSKLEHGFIVELLQDQSGYFKDWIRLDLDLDTEEQIPKSKWFSKFLLVARQPEHDRRC